MKSLSQHIQEAFNAPKTPVEETIVDDAIGPVKDTPKEEPSYLMTAPK